MKPKVWRIGSQWGRQEDLLPIFSKYSLAFAGEDVQHLIARVNKGDILAITKGKTILAVGKVKEILPLNKISNQLVAKFDDVNSICLYNLLKLEETHFEREIYDGQGKQFHEAHHDYQDKIIQIYKHLNSFYMIKSYREIVSYKKQIVLQGPPGTGKTYLAKKIAQEMITSEVKLSPLDYIEHYIQNFKQNNITLKTLNSIQSLLDEFNEAFPAKELKELSIGNYVKGKGSHSSFCYWIENVLAASGRFSPGPGGNYVYGLYYSPEANDYKINKIEGKPEEAMQFIASTLYKLVNHKDTSIASKYFRKSFILKILNSYYPEEYFPIYSHKHLNLIAIKLFNLEINGKDDVEINLMINDKFGELKEKHKSEISNFQLMWHLYEKFNIKEGLEGIDETKEIELGEYKLIQFHPAYTYEDFVRGITAKVNSDNIVEYQVENRVLASFADKALKDNKSNYVLIIDEINRANLPSVFGELIYALEYRYDKENLKETSVESMYSIKTGEDDEIVDNTLTLPDNLYIIGTMNTADRSVGHIDYAIRRRFAFIDVLPTPEPIKEFARAKFEIVSKLFVKNYEDAISAAQRTLEPSDYLAPDFRPEDVWIGHSYFITEQEGEAGEKELRMKLDYEVIPLLKEYIKDGILSEEARKVVKEL